MLKFIRLAAYGLIALLVAGVGGALWWRGEAPRLSDIGMAMPGGVSVGGPFTLVNGAGETVTDASFRGRWMLVYFGYTFCPDVCPTDLQTISAALDRLGPLAQRLVPVFITVDPERDTPAALAEYTKLFDERLVGLSGSKEQIAAAAKSYRVYYARTKSKDASDYLMDHSSFIYLVGPDGGFRALFRHGMAVQELADAVKARLESGS
jgi:cytochrome oxidase Cu insertion factor (SCO1/SenC/PrrC family)